MSKEDSFITHLLELRTRLVRAVLAIVVCTALLLPFANRIYDYLALPLLNNVASGTKMIAIGVITPFFIPLKLSLMLGLLIALPYVLYQIWGFIAPALYQHEKRWIFPLVVSSTILFFLGMAFAYFFVLGAVFGFVAAIAPDSITVAPDIESYFNFVLSLFLVFGLAFEVPIVVSILVLSGVMPIEKLKKIRPYTTVGAFVIAAIVTPPDVISQLMLAIPLILLYELGLLLASLLSRLKYSETTIIKKE